MKIKKVLRIVWLLLFTCLIVFLVFSVNTFIRYSSLRQISDSYFFAWPGILPDHKLYKFKVLRDKITGKIIMSPVKKIEFDLLMADKRIYASKLLVDKGEIALAKETALKGENYYSVLVQDYNRALQKQYTIPPLLDRKITQAASAHQKIFQKLENSVALEDKKTFQVVLKFSKINYNFIVGLRNSKKS